LTSLVSDHGEEFFEHGKKGHFETLFDESLLVPFIVRYPGVIAPGTRIGGVAGLEDVAPTLLGLAGLAPFAEASGQNHRNSLVDGGEVRRPQLLHFGTQRALRGPGWKVTYRTDTKESLYYDLSRDPLEKSPAPAADAAPKKITQLLNRLNEANAIGEALHWEEASTIELDASMQDRLRELGYIE
jgi:arylsulfatase A-like enzyme